MNSQVVLQKLQAFRTELDSLIATLASDTVGATQSSDQEDPFADLPPIEREVLSLVSQRPNAPYREIASLVRIKFPTARTTDRSVASTIRDAKKDSRKARLLPEALVQSAQQDGEEEMATKADLERMVFNALKALGGRGRIPEVAKQISDEYDDELRRSGDLYYTWQYDMRWAGQRLQDKGKLRKIGNSGIWELC